MSANRSPRSCVLISAAILVALAVRPERASACQAGMPLIIAEEDLIVDTDAEVFVARVSSVSAHKPTRARPPRVVLQIEETIRGTPRKRLRTVWECPYNPESDNPDGPAPTKAQREAMREYAREPLKNPRVGEKWLVIIETWPDGPHPILPIAAKFPLSAERRRWADEQLKLRRRYEAERNQYRDAWAPLLTVWGDQLPDGARPVTADTTLQPGTPVLVKYATTTQGYVVEVLKDGRVKIRPQGYDSRRDDVVPRDKLMLYPPG